MKDAYFVFDYYYNLECHAWVPLRVRHNKMRFADGWEFTNPEDNSFSEWDRRLFRFLREQQVSVVFTAYGKSCMNDWLFGFQIHYSDGTRKDFHHFDPVRNTDRFKQEGVELRLFRR